MVEHNFRVNTLQSLKGLLLKEQMIEGLIEEDLI